MTNENRKYADRYHITVKFNLSYQFIVLRNEFVFIQEKGQVYIQTDFTQPIEFITDFVETKSN